MLCNPQPEVVDAGACLGSCVNPQLAAIASGVIALCFFCCCFCLPSSAGRGCDADNDAEEEDDDGARRRMLICESVATSGDGAALACALVRNLSMPLSSESGSRDFFFGFLVCCVSGAAGLGVDKGGRMRVRLCAPEGEKNVVSCTCDAEAVLRTAPEDCEPAEVRPCLAAACPPPALPLRPRPPPPAVGSELTRAAGRSNTALRRVAAIGAAAFCAPLPFRPLLLLWLRMCRAPDERGEGNTLSSSSSLASRPPFQSASSRSLSLSLLLSTRLRDTLGFLVLCTGSFIISAAPFPVSLLLVLALVFLFGLVEAADALALLVAAFAPSCCCCCCCC